ncbi:hypothetical protein D3C81_1023500 [compost metagenome]
MYAVVQEREFADALGQYLVVELHVGEDFLVGQEVHLGAALVCRADDLHRRDFHGVAVRTGHGLHHAVLYRALGELDQVDLAVAAHGQAQPLGQRVHARHAHAVQAAGYLVAVLVELAARMQLGHGDFRRAALRLVLVVELHRGRNATAVVDDRDRVVAVDRDLDFGAITGQRFVDGVVEHLEHEVVQASTVGGVADIHARALAYRLQAFQDLDRRGSVRVFLLRILLVGHVFLLTILTANAESGPGAGLARGLGSAMAGYLKTAKGADRWDPAPAAVCARFVFWTVHGHPRAGGHGRSPGHQIRIGMTTYLKLSSSGTVIRALELESPRLTCTCSLFRLASTSSR